MRLGVTRFSGAARDRAAASEAQHAGENCGGLIALTGGPAGPLDQAIAQRQPHLVASRCDTLMRLFDDRLYIELQRHGLPSERDTEPQLIDLAYDKGIPLVATNQPFFATADDHEAHDALICIAQGRMVGETDRKRVTVEHRFKTRAEMAALFADLPEALASTVEIAQRCAVPAENTRADPAALHRGYAARR